MSLGGQSYFMVVTQSGSWVSRHRTVTAAAKRIVRDGAVGLWQIKRQGVLRLIPISPGEQSQADAILYPAIQDDQ